MDYTKIPKLKVTTPSERSYTPSPKRNLRRPPELTRLLFLDYHKRLEEFNEEECCQKCPCLCTIV